jgi:hypothetical protein
VRAGDGVLAVVSNLGRSEQTSAITFDLRTLQMRAGEIAARDAMSDEPLGLEHDRLTLNLKPESCRLVLVTTRR